MKSFVVSYTTDVQSDSGCGLRNLTVIASLSTFATVLLLFIDILANGRLTRARLSY